MSSEKSAESRKRGRPQKGFTPKTMLSERLCEALGGREVAEIAKIMGVSARSASRYLNGETDPPSSVLAKVAAATQRTARWLLIGTEGSPADASPGIPVLACANTADPNGVCRVAESHAAYGEENRIVLPVGIHAVRVHGDSMVPVALDGQHVLVSDDPAETGDLAVVECRDGRVMIKRVSFCDRIVACGSVNPDPRFKPIVLPRSEVRRMRKIVGVWMGKVRQ